MSAVGHNPALRDAHIPVAIRRTADVCVCYHVSARDGKLNSLRFVIALCRYSLLRNKCGRRALAV